LIVVIPRCADKEYDFVIKPAEKSVLNGPPVDSPVSAMSLDELFSTYLRELLLRDKPDGSLKRHNPGELCLVPIPAIPIRVTRK